MAMNWGIELLRLSLFSDDTLKVADADLESLFGKSEEYTLQNRPGGWRYDGQLLGGVFTLAAAGTRTDLLLSLRSPPEQPGGPSELKLPIIGPWNTLREEFVSVTSKWLAERKSRILRIAFGGVLLLPTKDRLEGYSLLKTLLTSVNVIPDEMRDLLFRINWPVESAVIKGLILNRLTSWNSVQLSQIVRLS